MLKYKKTLFCSHIFLKKKSIHQKFTLKKIIYTLNINLIYIKLNTSQGFDRYALPFNIKLEIRYVPCSKILKSVLIKIELLTSH